VTEHLIHKNRWIKRLDDKPAKGTIFFRKGGNKIVVEYALSDSKKNDWHS